MKYKYCFWIITLLSAAVWIVLPSVFRGSYQSDVVELIAAGKEWVLSTRKHPMFAAWFLETLNLLTGRAFYTPFFAQQICTVITAWSVWQLGRKTLTENAALLAGLAVLPYNYFTVEVFNCNITSAALWALTVYLAFQAFQTDKLRYWISAGIVLGLAFHSKYNAVFMAAAILSYMIFYAAGRRHWKRPGPYLTTAAAFLIFIPHLLWLYQYDFATIKYAASRNEPSAGWSPYFIYPLEWCGGQFTLFGQPLLIILLAAGLKIIRQNPAKKCNPADFLFCVLFVPFLLHLLFSFTGTHIRTAYGCPFWSMFPVWFLLRFPAVKIPVRRIVLSVLAGELIFVCIFFSHIKSQRYNFPMRQLAAECERVWHEQYNFPVPYITGDWLAACNAAYAMPERPTVHFYWENIHEKDAVLPERGQLTMM